MTAARLAIVALVGLASCGPESAELRQSSGVLVIAVDALRVDHISGLGYDRPTTPALDRLAAEGATFTDAWSASPDVLPAHTAILTGCDPGLAHRPGLTQKGPASDLTGWLVPDGLPSMAQEFLARGFETAGFADHPAVAPIRGVARGFQTFGGYREDAIDPELELGFEGVATKFVHWLSGRSASADWFAYLQVNDLERVWSRRGGDARWGTLYEPRPQLAAMPPVAEGDHAFFAIPRPRWAGFPRSVGEYELRYDGAIAQLDTKLGRLLERLRRMGRLENTTVIVVGTFGVSFGEGGLYLDSGALTPADLRVPWIIRPAADLALQRGARVDEIASLVDLAPTLLELHGLRVPTGMTGVSHAARLRGADAPPPRTSVLAAGGFQRGIAIVDPRWILARERPADAPTALLVRTWFGGDPPPTASTFGGDPPPTASSFGGDAPPTASSFGRDAPPGALGEGPSPTAGPRGGGTPSTAASAGTVERLVARTPSRIVSTEDSDAARARLGPQLTAWADWIERARSILHGRVTPAADPKTAADLRRRGLLSAR